MEMVSRLEWVLQLPSGQAYSHMVHMYSAQQTVMIVCSADLSMLPWTWEYALSYSWLAGWLLGIDYHAKAPPCLEHNVEHIARDRVKLLHDSQYPGASQQASYMTRHTRMSKEALIELLSKRQPAASNTDISMKMLCMIR